MGAYGTPEHLPNQDDFQNNLYGGYGQYPCQPVKKHHKKAWIIIISVIVVTLVATERYGAYLNSRGYNPDINAFAVISSQPPKENSSILSGETIPASFISKATYDKLKTGMTYEDVVNLFGLSGKQIYESGERGSENFVTSYLWKNENGPQQIQINFVDNKLYDKTEYYLE
ncbi:hypothetical protein ACRQV7_03005 [Caproiciproducens sp. R2]|uniref:hypothetical protein n=1 Tax=Caproiciproducens sp. R2 TaxID=3435187 RepID=UPI004033F003